MKKLILLITVLLIQGCASNFLVNQAQSSGALPFDAIMDLPKEKAIGQLAYVGGQVATVDRSKGQVELIKRNINDSGYPVEGSNDLEGRIFISFAPNVKFDFYDSVPGDRMAVLGKVIDVQKVNLAGNNMTILQVEAEDYRTWTSQRRSRWNDDPWDLWGYSRFNMGYNRFGYYY